MYEVLQEGIIGKTPQKKHPYFWVCTRTHPTGTLEANRQQNHPHISCGRILNKTYRETICTEAHQRTPTKI